MGDWREKVKLPAKFRGAPFWVESSELGTGRRSVTHEFPFKEKEPVYVEDTGREGRTFTVQGFVVGTEYQAARDKLLTELEKPGPGELVHPYHGTRRVLPGKVSVRETATDGGMAMFSIEFKETAASPAEPSAKQDSKGKIAVTTAASTAAASTEFLARYSPSNLLDSVTGSLESAVAALDGMLATVTLETQALAQLKRQIADFTTSIGDLVEAPAELLAVQLELFESVAAALLESATINPCAALLALYSFNPGVRPPATTPNRIAERANFDATQQLIQRLVLIQACNVAVEQTFESYEAAMVTREAITDLLDEQAETVADDVYPVLMQLRADLVKAVPGEATDLPKLVTHTPLTTVPSLVLAHRLYGNLDSEADLIARNRIRNPGFVTGRVEIEVLSA